MRCLVCGGVTSVKDSRPAKLEDGTISVRRRRHCLVCSQRYTTVEVPVRKDRRRVVPDYPELLRSVAEQLKLVQDDIADMTEKGLKEEPR